MESNTNKSLASMDAFGSMFSEEDQAAKHAEADYQAAIKAANGSPSKMREAEATYQKELSKIATSTLRKDKKLALKVPFVLDKKTKGQINNNKAYYEHERILRRISHPLECVTCGAKQKKDDVFVAYTRGGGDASCLACADDRVIIDKKSYELVIL